MRYLLRPISNLVQSFSHIPTVPRLIISSHHLMSKRKLHVVNDDVRTQRPSQIRKMTSEPKTTTTIRLTPKESQLKDVLLDVARYVGKTHPTSEPVVLRWAGGWVRDKLLGVESHDIDTAINVMTGESFAQRICELCEKPETIEKHNISATDVGNLYRVARNPEKSKHLETSTIKLFGYDVDFVNLRKETYTVDSRNPQMEFGTAEEDALRRDATVNALFYNLHTGRVEDYTTGLTDMQAKLIRTPLEPFQTFMDDPLRVLRLVRFASRLGFTIDPEVERVMGNARVLEILQSKISRERVGIELEKMLKGNHPRRSLQYIDELGLYHTIFTDPTRPTIAKPEVSHWHLVYELVHHLYDKKTPGSIYDVLVRSDEAAYHAWVLAALAPWENVEQPRYEGNGKAPPPYGTLAAREGIKAPNKLCNLITSSHKHRDEIMSLKNAVARKETHIYERDLFGMAIRHWDSRDGHWRLQVLSALLFEAMTVTAGDRKSPASRDNFLQGWQQFLDHLVELDVFEAPSLKRLVDGKQLAEALGVRPGKWMVQALEVCVSWQLRHPEAKDSAGAIEEVIQKREELGIPSA